ncbi:MAG TPA: methylthioribulose 1-phosphate dehydratase [Candidatus Angelobacter sp.]
MAAAAELEKLLAELGRSFYARGWMLGTSGNFSAVLGRDPLRISISSSGIDKGNLAPEHFVQIDISGNVVEGSGQPSAETALHLMLVRVRGAGAVLHTHSVWSTILSDEHAVDSGLWIEGYEMLKGLEGIRSHKHREWLPIVENDQDMRRLAGVVEALLKEHPQAHGFLLQGHGLYTWGEDLARAKRHLEILEFLLEVVGRSRCGLSAGG